MKKLAATAVLVASLGVADTGPARANDLAICTAPLGKTESNARLAACERLILSGKARGNNLANAYGYRGIAYNELGQYDRAVAELTEAIRLVPRHWAGYDNRGLSYARLGQYDRAIADFNESIRLNPGRHTATFTNRGLAYHFKRDFDRAIADFDEAIRIAPKLADTYVMRAESLTSKHEYERALRDYDRAIELNPSFFAAYLNRGAVLRARDPDKALADLKRAIELNPRHPEPYAVRAVIHAERKNFAEAFADFDRALAVDPNSAATFNNRGFVYIAMGEPDRALADLNEAIRLDPRSAAAYKNRGLAYEAKGEFQRAIAEFRQALSLDPFRQEATDGLARVTSRAASAPGAGRASSLRQTLESLRLIGTWAPDCAKPPGPQNLYLVVRAIDENHAQLDRMAGASARHSAYLAQNASEHASGEVTLQARGTAGAETLALRLQSEQLLAFGNWHRRCG